MSAPPQPSWRKPAGAFLIMALIAGWAALVVTIVDAVPVLQNPVTYVVAGVVWIWILPLRRLLRWMELGVWR